ncbi:GNAT family N-acetyltransferase [Shewanella sp. AS1]|uniref:GNAT family N-acetyltransferase n=1 Tax=Shewanella sp. AS1 TaxID=2907626 RepID=UPI001F425660|nr:GNAT family N-acetyltransferase [Shewanella sp. AS1]MCE9678403.1 GNAT family N-acetyltransferase [Shewanella sp. AS1]
MKIANSARLSYQMMTHDDAALLFELDQDPQVMRFINGGKPSTLHEIETLMLPRLAAYTNRETGWGLWKVSTLRATPQDNGDAYSSSDLHFIGWILVRPMDFFSDAPKFDDIELGWRFKQSSWGKGYGTEAAMAISDAIAKQASVNYLSAVADEANTASIGIMKKLGMKYVKTDGYATPNGEVEVVYYQMSVIDNEKNS